MSWKDVLAIVADAEIDEPAIAVAGALAAKFDAAFSAAFLTPLPDEPLAYEPTVVAGVWAELLGRARARAEQERGKIETRLKALARPAELRTAEALSRDLGRVAAVHARYADIAVLTRPPEGAAGDLRAELIEGILFYSGRAVLVAPPQPKAEAPGARIVVAWDASREATRALSEAQPLLDRAERVFVVTVDAKPKTFGHGEQPGANIAAHLGRRGMAVEVRNVDGTGRTPAQAILDEALAVDADLIVLGGYTHSRLREMMFGGATRDLMRASPLSLLMAH
ncbi:MAG: universal stress protein [Hyphomonadaceae bacterium]